MYLYDAFIKIYEREEISTHIETSLLQITLRFLE